MVELVSWAEELKQRYLAGEASLFLLHGNVRDLYPWTKDDGTIEYLDLQSYLHLFLGRTKDTILYYNIM